MSEPAPRRWSVQEFFAWQERQDERSELVGGVPLRMMAGARNVHGDIDLPELGMSLALADAYDGVAFPARPRLVSGA
ncbi:hypothetical protein [Methylobacterium aquaticum]|jgi:hypothetical protein|uniref:Uncharacterized protein n=1 Tax=Methylobacterium aquaticum TaxID=270351 RepID=A0A0J6SFR1_9HYPH|nr:hypothetical protein [Methylobacterium aquaticum]KMO34020.1 hypothetical protein VP06_15405 [Methylobacterium aquaticum]